MTVRRAAYILILASAAGGVVASLVSLAAGDQHVAAVAAGVLAAGLVAAIVWDDQGVEQEFRFTQSGALAAGWMLGFLFPPVGIAIGAVLVRRGSRRGRVLLYGSVTLLAIYVIVGALVI